MPDYSLNWTAKSSAIQKWQCVNDAARPPEGLKSAICHWPSGTDARQSAKKPLHEAATERYICLSLPPGRTWHKVNDSKVDYRKDLSEGKVGLDYAGHRIISAMWVWYLSLHPTRQDLTQGQWPEGRL